MLFVFCRKVIPKWDHKEWAHHTIKLNKLAKPKKPKKIPKEVNTCEYRRTSSTWILHTYHSWHFFTFFLSLAFETHAAEEYEAF